MHIFGELSLIIVVATVIAAVIRLLKQPIVMAYIITGIVVGPLFLDLVESAETVEVFAKFGVSILLFIVGIGLSPKIIKEVGKVSLITGIGQVLFTTIFGFLIAKAFHYTTVTSLFIAVALTFSSTIIILKLLSDKKDTQKLYGRISIGFLLVQDVVATFILVIASSGGTGGDAFQQLLFTMGKGVLLTGLLVIISTKMLPKLEDFFATSQEFLFLLSIGWGLGLATVFYYLGFSIEIGALISGVTLSISPYAKEIESKLKPLRDFFVIMFFVFLGSEVGFENIQPVIIQSIIFSVFVLVGNPLIVIILMGLLGYNKKTSFMAGLTVAQISEFSLIMVLLGVETGLIERQVLTLVTLVGLTTIAGSTYLIMYSEKIYPKLAKYLRVFERKRHMKETSFLGAYEIILFGCNRVGYDFLKMFKEEKIRFLVVDFDPEIVADLTRDGINIVYGDAEDGEFLDEINIGEAKLVVSTIPDHEANLFLLSKIKHTNEEAIVIMISYNINEALDLYSKGASYVILPHFIGSNFAVNKLSEHGMHYKKFVKEKDKHMKYLEERKALGHAHPTK